jgi:hypothetical protein
MINIMVNCRMVVAPTEQVLPPTKPAKDATMGHFRLDFPGRKSVHAAKAGPLRPPCRRPSPAVSRASGGGGTNVAHQRRRSKWKRHSYTPIERPHLSRGRVEAPPRRLNQSYLEKSQRSRSLPHSNSASNGGGCIEVTLPG